jgi:hypothetical protein
MPTASRAGFVIPPCAAIGSRTYGGDKGTDFDCHPRGLTLKSAGRNAHPAGLAAGVMHRAVNLDYR